MAQKPLAGKRILVGRARAQAETLSVLLRRQSATVIEIPLIEIRPPRSYRSLDTGLKRIEDYDWLILTSVNGVEALKSRARKLGITLRSYKDLRIVAIGPATRAALERGGLHVNLTPSEYIAESVVRAIHSRVRGKRVLLVRARVARDVIPRGLRRAGARVDVAEAYGTGLPAGSRARLRALLRDPASRPHAITFTSSSTARNFAAMLGPKMGRKYLHGIVLASVGPVTSTTLREFGLRPTVEARRYDMKGLATALCAYFSTQRKLA